MAEQERTYFVHDSSVVDDGASIGAGTKVWHFSHICGQAEIGRDVSIGQNCYVGPGVVVGDGCKIQNNVSVYQDVVLEQDVFCGPSMVFTNVKLPRANVSRKDEFAPTRVKRGATIGANATVVCGATLGRYCFVAAGAVVTRDVRDFALVAGNPAKAIGWVCRCGERLGDVLKCGRCEATYRIDESQLVEHDG